MERRRHASRSPLAAALTACLLASGCAAGAESAPPPSEAPHDSPLPTVAATPLPTLESTTEVVDEPPAGAITIDIKGARFIPDEVTAEAGTVAFFLTNTLDPASHNMLIGPDIHTPLARSETLLGRQSGVFTVEGLEPGTYAIWCSVSDHVSFGMVGTVTITP